eukprot:CAMPEP_0170614856 /NCGR_PEP_ID=MMETSP0224-20130122/25027_1 /TAXON_ID=285029 /ORGANISM="Togula jolla, Strain CCCM 725" /LENGTH=420 /DNA_ID=CAMNT_0010940549 /DNA_START=240 /DNA_END=1502 /DNA_ORIENTATION=-
MDVRVTKGFGTRGYDKVRISVISLSSQPPAAGIFEYSARFMYKWSQLHLHSSVMTAVPGEESHFDVGTDLTVRLPRRGAGVAGVLIADPCVKSPTGRGWIPCALGDKFQTLERTPALINAFVGDRDTDYWGLLGDNFYDRTGEITVDVFRRISLEAKSKLFVTVAGNHDYWVYGAPALSSVADQCGYGHMQYYAQDTKASISASTGASPVPFDFSVDPDKDRWFGHGCNLPAFNNSFWYHQIGNVALVGQSGAYSLEETRPFMEEACEWLSEQPDLELAVLLGHWDVPGMGASDEMAMPTWYSEMAAESGCAKLQRRGILKFVVGHTHCNGPLPHTNGDGFRVAGFGMEGCGDYGVPILDTTSGRARIWYFNTATDELYNAVLSCVKLKGWRECTSLATLWMDQPIGTGDLHLKSSVRLL